MDVLFIFRRLDHRYDLKCLLLERFTSARSSLFVTRQSMVEVCVGKLHLICIQLLSYKTVSDSLEFLHFESR